MGAIRSALVIGGGIAGHTAALALQKAGIDATVYEAYELGERMPTADFLVALRERTGISLGWLFGSNQQCPMPNRSAQSLRSVSAYPSNLSISSRTDAVSAEADRSTPAKVAKFALG